MKKIYIIRRESYNNTTSYHHYYDVAIYTNRKAAERHIELFKQNVDPNERIWVSEAFAYSNTPF